MRGMTKQKNQSEERLLTRQEVCARVGGIDRVTLWRWIVRGMFPRPIRPHMRRNLWRESVVEKWLAEQ